MQNDLISRQAAIRFIRDKVSLSLFMKRSVDKADKACMELCDMLDRELPSAQPQIIRCGQCKHCYVDGEGVLFNVCELNHNKVQSDDWYCADGERGDSDDDNGTD
jgi:hypothetical protein